MSREALRFKSSQRSEGADIVRDLIGAGLHPNFICALQSARAIFVRVSNSMRSKRVKWLVSVFAVLCNLGGGPMAWAHLAGASHCQKSGIPAAMQMAPDCPQHHPGSRQLPCCNGGSCACGAPASMPSVNLVPPPADRVLSVLADARPMAAPCEYIDDALRPPIY
jgi:hypothetical protein